jgi:hypothetical protein
MVQDAGESLEVAGVAVLLPQQPVFGAPERPDRPEGPAFADDMPAIMTAGIRVVVIPADNPPYSRRRREQAGTSRMSSLVAA